MNLARIPSWQLSEPDARKKVVEYHQWVVWGSYICVFFPHNGEERVPVNSFSQCYVLKMLAAFTRSWLISLFSIIFPQCKFYKKNFCYPAVLT